MKNFRGFFMVLALLGITALPASAGPPFLTDDPQPVDLNHFEFYWFQTVGISGGATQAQAPAVEFNWGALPDLQLHIVSSLAYAAAGDGGSAYGFGDSEAGIKFRFVGKEPESLQIGIFPLVELPTGDSARGLGNGSTWVKLPLWIQKSWGPWTTYGGGGYAFNGAPGARDYPFGGWLIQRNLSDLLSLGWELFAQGRDKEDDQGFLAVNIGGSLNFSPEFSLLFSGGHSLAGDDQTLAYLGLYWTWGK